MTHNYINFALTTPTKECHILKISRNLPCINYSLIDKFQRRQNTTPVGSNNDFAEITQSGKKSTSPNTNDT